MAVAPIELEGSTGGRSVVGDAPAYVEPEFVALVEEILGEEAEGSDAPQ
jgi:hypothetical protein